MSTDGRGDDLWSICRLLILVITGGLPVTQANNLKKSCEKKKKKKKKGKKEGKKEGKKGQGFASDRNENVSTHQQSENLLHLHTCQAATTVCRYHPACLYQHLGSSGHRPAAPPPPFSKTPPVASSASVNASRISVPQLCFLPCWSPVSWPDGSLCSIPVSVSFFLFLSSFPSLFFLMSPLPDMQVCRYLSPRYLPIPISHHNPLVLIGIQTPHHT